MPKISIQPTARDIETILSGPHYFRIPRFQRPFSWDVEHVDEFWNDAIRNFDQGYFIGPMVVYEEDDRDWGVVDGQQRLTIIALILVALRDNFEALNDNGLADATHRFIERPDPNGNHRFVLQSDVSEGAWINRMQQRRTDGDVLRKSQFDPDTWAAFAVISQSMTNLVEGSLTGAKSDKQRRQAQIQALCQIRDQVLSLTVIWVPLDAEDDAYEIFETLNARGKDLEVADRLKNYFLSRLRAANVNLDDHRRRWNILREHFEGAPSSRDLNRFILHWWLSRAPYVAERRVFKEIKSRIDRLDVALEFDRFEADAALYRTIIDPDSTNWTIERQDIRDALKGLRIMRLAQPMPFVLALMRVYESKNLKKRAVVKMLRVIENYHFQVTAISTKSSSGGVSEMYATHARQLTEASSNTDRHSQLSVLESKLIERAPSREDFVDAFKSRLIYADEYTRDKSLVRYVLERLHQSSNGGPQVDYATFSIEHVKPQSQIRNTGDLAIIGGIGNLLLVDHSLNGQLGSKRFAIKAKILREHSDNYDIGDILSADRWGNKEIRARAKRLGGLAFDEVWCLPPPNR